jgi:hypothetical protein
VKRAADDAFDRIGHGVFPDPWGARDRYVDVVIGRRELDGFVRTETYGDEGAAAVAEDLLELQRNAMSMFTSCAWFFNDVGGIETIQILRYAARTLELMEAVGAPAPRSRFLSVLGRAKSNDPSVGTGADAFLEAERARPQDSAA